MKDKPYKKPLNDSSPASCIMDALKVSYDIKSFIANELDNGCVCSDGTIYFTWEGKKYMGLLTILSTEDSCDSVEVVPDQLGSLKKYNGIDPKMIP